MVLNADVRQYYRDHPLMVSSPFGGVDGVNRELLAEVFGRLGIRVAGKRVLDVGCGRGYIGDYVRDQGGDYTGVDFVASRAGFRLALADAARLPFSDAAFDAVFCLDAFEHLPESREAAAEFRRVVRPDGFVFLSVPNYANVAGLVKWWCERFGGYEKDTWAPFRRWQPQELETPLTPGRIRRVFRDAGFQRMRRLAHGPEVGLGLFPWMAHPRMPEAVLFRLQRIFAAVGPLVARVWPDASLHHFWKLESGS